jgi:hypothetical protein
VALVSGNVVVASWPLFGESDAREPDAGESDTRLPDKGEPDKGEPDKGEPDKGEPGAHEPDAHEPDAPGPGGSQPDEGRPDLAVIGELARLQLAAKRMGYSVRLEHVTQPLSDLLAFAGLARAQTKTTDAGLVIEVGGQPECAEQVSVEEAVKPRDPPVRRLDDL